jgi:hypothetical protein
MTIRMTWLLRRLPGVTHEQFRAHYENSHAKMAQRYFGHLMTGYVRSYRSDMDIAPEWQSMRKDYDCLAEWAVPSEAAMHEILQTFADPVIGAEFSADEKHFLDVSSVVMLCTREADRIDTGPGDGPARPAFRKGDA